MFADEQIGLTKYFKVPMLILCLTVHYQGKVKFFRMQVFSIGTKSDEIQLLSPKTGFYGVGPYTSLVRCPSLP